MRDKVRFMADSTADGNNQPEFDQVVMAMVPCSIHDKTGGERFRGRQLQEETTIVIECRFIEGLKADMIAINERTGARYHIHRVLREQGRDRYLLVEGTEIG